MKVLEQCIESGETIYMYDVKNLFQVLFLIQCRK